jgi:predicted GIY-YIG superfamily endonuclease
MYVYIFECNGVYKIGRSKDPERRKKQLQTGNSNDYIIRRLYKTDNSVKLETLLHNYLVHSRINREWFNITPADWIYLDAIVETSWDFATL